MLLCFICALTHPPEAFTLWCSLNSLHNSWCPVLPKPSGPYWNSNNDSREINKTFQHLSPIQIPCQKQGHKGKGWEMHSGWLGPCCLQLPTQPCRHTNKHHQGSLWPTFPTSHGVLCHCETATGFQLHKDDKKGFKQPPAVRLTVRGQPLPQLHAFCQEPPHGAEVQLTQQPTHIPRTVLSPSFSSRSAKRTIPEWLHWSFLHILSAFEEVYNAETAATSPLPGMAASATIRQRTTVQIWPLMCVAYSGSTAASPTARQTRYKQLLEQFKRKHCRIAQLKMT